MRAGVGTDVVPASSLRPIALDAAVSHEAVVLYVREFTLTYMSESVCALHVRECMCIQHNSLARASTCCPQHFTLHFCHIHAFAAGRPFARLRCVHLPTNCSSVNAGRRQLTGRCVEACRSGGDSVLGC